MDALIPLIRELHDVFEKSNEKGISLPQLVVVGAQSSGKTSVLESIVQKNFLPRGTGIVTRCPLIIKLYNTSIKGDNKEYARFSHKKEVKFTDFDEVRKEILSRTVELAGEKSISSEKIYLEVYSPNVLDLVLCDLPGLTQVATHDQSSDLPQKITETVKKFISVETAIILAVCPANSDLANSVSLSLARECDPTGERTIGILTKVDLVDRGASVRDELLNKVHQLKHGYIGVINRSQDDIKTNKSFRDAYRAEKEFFQSNANYSDLKNVGYDYLCRTLNEIFLNHIKTGLPTLYKKINEVLLRKQVELKSYGTGTGETKVKKQMFSYQLMENYLSLYNGYLNGTSDNIRVTGIDGGRSLVHYLVEDLQSQLKAIPSARDVDKDVVEELIESHSGLQRSIFFPEATFHHLIRERVELMRQPCVAAAEVVHHRMIELHSKVILPELDRFPRTKEELQRAVLDISKESLEECIKFINNLIDIQAVYVNVQDMNFLELSQKQKKDEKSNITLLLEMIDKYFELSRKEISDVVPKAIHRILIKKCTEALRLKLFETLVIEPDLTEDRDVAEMRNKCIRSVECLKEAVSILNKVRSYKLY